MRFVVRKRMLLVLVLTVAGLPALAWAKDDPGKGIENDSRILLAARDTFQELIDASDRKVPRELLSRAKAVAVFPRVINAAIGIGGRRGKGVVSVRGADGTWGPPAFFKITGGSWGFQIGAQSTELVLFFMTERGVRSLLDSKFTLGGKAGLAAGPLGRSAEAATDLKLSAEIYSYAKSKGLFAGISLEGARLAPDRDGNRKFYDTEAGTEAILFRGEVGSRPEVVQTFLSALPSAQ